MDPGSHRTERRPHSDETPAGSGGTQVTAVVDRQPHANDPVPRPGPTTGDAGQQHQGDGIAPRAPHGESSTPAPANNDAPAVPTPANGARSAAAPPNGGPVAPTGATPVTPTAVPPPPVQPESPPAAAKAPPVLAPEPVPVTPPPQPFADGLGSVVPSDQTIYTGAFSQRLRAMLPWPSTTDPVTALIRSHRTIHPGSDAGLLRKAYSIAEQMHRGQMRKSGEPYISHPLTVAQILADLGLDTTTLVAALLHDTVEDTNYTLAALERDFGSEVAILVDGVTKFDKVFYGKDAEVETIRKMMIMAGRDVRVLIIKLADRLHNMRTIDARSRASQARIASATQDVLIPLCDKLGIQVLKRELEDWVLRALSPDGYARIIDYLARRRGREEYLARVIAQVNEQLDLFKIDATVTPRPRHLYSIWKDTVAGSYPVPHDLPRIVIIVDGPETDCYAALGAVHARWRPVPGRFKDFIASPKNNLYRSLHTTVLGPEDNAVEVLIRTDAMHRTSEYGIIANFRYPQQAAGFGPAAKAEQLEWLHRLLDWQGAAADPAQFLASLRCDLAEAQIIVFTSTGRPVLLPADATPIDLAYTLGADVGHRCIGARLNGRLVPLSSTFSDGDAVEIITRPGQRDEFDFDDNAPAPGPSAEWLNMVRTPHARLHISRWFSDHEAPAATIANKVRLGRAAIGLALRHKGRGLASDLPLLRLLPSLGFPDLETLLVAVADHKISAEDVVADLIALVDQTPP